MRQTLDEAERAAYGKGYCDALTEDEPGSLCRDHGYVVPARMRAATTSRLHSSTARASDQRSARRMSMSSSSNSIREGRLGMF